MSDADRLDIRDLVERYAQCADRADGPGVAALFVPDGALIIYLTPGAAEPTSTRRGREEISTALAALDRYRLTMHLIASHTATIIGDGASGETRCVAHHIADGRDQVMSIRYADVFVHHEGHWRFAQREVRVLHVEDRSCPSP